MAICLGRRRRSELKRYRHMKTIIWASITVVFFIGILHRHSLKATEDLPAIQLYSVAVKQPLQPIQPVQPTQIIPMVTAKRKVRPQNSTHTYKHGKGATAVKAKETAKLMEKRREQVRKACKNKKELYDVYKGRSRISRRYNFLYCPVEKVASTFWRRFIYQLELTDLKKSPYEVSVNKIYGSPTIWSPFIIREKEGPALRQLLNRSTKMLFVRDPYSRLLSAYVDKLLAPNPIYWNVWGTKAILWYRTIHPISDIRCGEDATFSEFVSFTLSTTWETDHHVMPINKQCSPCFVNYSIIGKMETFQNDVNHLLSLLNISTAGKYLDEMEQMRTLDAIEDSVSDAFSDSWMKRTLKCISKDEAARRIWRKLQIRGVISWRSKYNLDFHTAQNMSGPEYIDILKKVLKESKASPRELKLQKKQALVEAFSTLTRSQLYEIAKIFHSDLIMFDYKELLTESIRGVKITGAFDLSRNWDLGSLI